MTNNQFGGEPFFSTNDGLHGSELWKSDGTTTDTTLAKDVYPGASSSMPSQLADIQDTLFFSANDGATGRAVGAASQLQPEGDDLCR